MFGNNDYSEEELVAELGAAFLCAESDIEHRVIDNQASYINSWLSRLQNDKKLIVYAAAKAQKAVEFILNIKKEKLWTNNNSKIFITPTDGWNDSVLSGKRWRGLDSVIGKTEK